MCSSRQWKGPGRSMRRPLWWVGLRTPLLGPQRRRELCLAVGRRAVEHRRGRGVQRAADGAGPPEPAATRSSPVIASLAWRSSSSQRRAASGAPSAPASATVSGASRRSSAQIADGSLHAAQHRRERPRAGGGGHDRVALARRELEAVEALGEHGRRGVQAARRQRDEVRARVVRGEALRALDDVGVDGEAGQQPRPEPERLEAADRAPACGSPSSSRSSAPSRGALTVASAPSSIAANAHSRVASSIWKRSRAA